MADQSTERPSYSLEDAEASITANSEQWLNSNPPKKSDWARLVHVLERAERASIAIDGLSNLLRCHYHAEQLTREQDWELRTLNGYHIGAVEEAQSLLVRMVYSAFDDLRTAAVHPRGDAEVGHG